MKSVIERFWSKVDIRGFDDCWPWLAGKDKDGYGLFWNIKLVRATRYCFQLAFPAQFDSDLEVCHTCDNPPCCNPNHLWQGTQADNIDDMCIKGRAPCPRGTKLSIDTIRMIREEFSLRPSQRRTMQQIAAVYNVSYTTINSIVNYKIHTFVV